MDSVADVDALGHAATPGAAARRWGVGRAVVELAPDTEELTSPRSERWLVRGARRVIEVGIAIIGLLVVGLAMPLLTLLIRLDSPGPAIFRQRRMGRDGRPFTIYKLRSMVRDAELLREGVLALNVMNGLTFKAPEDPRRTRVGRALRRLSLDEAPQFWNVLRGDMALVGPRPPLPSEHSQYSEYEHARLLVKPGITGMWQVAGRNTIEHSDMIDLDLDYVRRRSLWLDVAIILRTVPAMVRGRGAY